MQTSVFFTLIVLALVPTARAAHISLISTDPEFKRNHLSGSMSGGTRLYIRGTGFDERDFDNEVFVGQYKAEVDNYYTSESLLVADLPPMFYGQHKNLRVAVRVKGQYVECKAGDCALDLELRYTPLLYSVQPQSLFAGGQIRVHGVWRSNTFSEMRDVKISGRNCVPTEKQQESDQLHYWGYTSFECSIPQDLEIGGHMLDVVSAQGTGFVHPRRESFGFEVGNKSQKYNVRVHPLVTSVSSNSGFLSGQILEIRGKGFGKENVSVKVAGAECKILELTSEVSRVEEVEVKEDVIKCELEAIGSAPEEKLFKGGAGLRNQVFQGYDRSFDYFLDEVSGKTMLSDTIMLSTENLLDSSQYMQKVWGVFRSRGKGTYTFKIAGDDQTRLYLSRTPIDYSREFKPSEILEMKCDIPGWTYHREFHRYPTQICDVDLEEDEDYYLMAFQTEGGGGDSLTIAVIVPNEDAGRPNQKPQVQKIEIQNESSYQELALTLMNATGGDFKLTFVLRDSKSGHVNYYVEVLVPFDVSPERLCDLLWRKIRTPMTCNRTSLDASGKETKSESPAGYKWSIKFEAYRSKNAIPLIDTSGLIGSEVQGRVEEVVPQTDPIQGSFKLQYGEYTTRDISYADSWHSLKWKLEEMSPLMGGVSVYHVGGASEGRHWYVVMDSFTGDADDISVVEDNITGGSPSIAQKVKVVPDFEPATSALVYLPIPSDFLRTINSLPQVNVQVGDMLAGCQPNDCDYRFLAPESAPSVTKFWLYKSSGKIKINIKMPVESRRLAADAESDFESEYEFAKENVLVRFANSNCKVTFVSSKKVVCKLPMTKAKELAIESGSYVPRVHWKGKGYLGVDAAVTPVEIPLKIKSVSPSKGSLGGGTIITISGTGFAANSSYGNHSAVKIGDKECLIQSFSTTQIICETPENADASKENLTVEVNGNSASADFEYSHKETPLVIGLSPKTASPVLKNDLVIDGVNFGSDKKALQVILEHLHLPGVEYECNVTRTTDDQVTCRLGGGKTGNYRVKIRKNGVGYSMAGSVGADTFTYESRIFTVSPARGSIAGGTVLTITGSNFSSVPKENQVVIGEGGWNVCVILTASPTELTCRVNPPKEVLSGPQTVHVLGRIQEQAKCNGVCEFAFEDESTPKIDEVVPQVASAGENVTIKGSGFSKGAGERQLWLGEIEVSEFSVLGDGEITFVMPKLVHNSYLPKLFVGNLGYAQLNLTGGIDTVLEMTHVSPNVASMAGAVMTIQGNGFNPDIMQVKIGSRSCEIDSISNTKIECQVPWYNTGGKDVSVSLVFTDQNGVQQEITCDSCTYKTYNTRQSIWHKENYSSESLESVSFDVTGDYIDQKFGDASVVYPLKSARVWLRATKTRELDSFSIEGSVDSFEKKRASLSFGRVTAGVYDLHYHTDSVGNANVSNNLRNLTFLPFVTSHEQVNSSLAGGSLLKVTGSGFPSDDQKHRADARVCGQPCRLVSSSFDQLECLTPGINTLDVHNSLNLLSPQIQRNAVVTGDYNHHYMDAVIDGDLNTFYSGAGNSSCFVQLDYGEHSYIRATKIRMFPRVNSYEPNLIGAEIQGSMDGVNFTTFATVDESVVENWNVYQPNPELNEVWEFRFLRFAGGVRHCQISELEVTGYEFAVLESFDLEKSLSCDFSLSVLGADLAAPVSGAVVYSRDYTPEVTQISPKLGPTSGGTKLIISGKNFSKDSEVVIDGVLCNIIKIRSNKIICKTGPRATFQESSLVIRSNTVGEAATHGHVFLYIDRWSDPQTWGGETPPRKGDSVHVPKGQVLLVDQSTPELYAVVVEGTLMFEDAKDLTFDAWFIVVKEGRFLVGSPEKPHKHKLTITMYGTRESKMLPGFGNKSIMVHNGQIDIHGKPVQNTWTTLASHACAGDRIIVLSEKVKWKRGDQIIVAPTGRDRNEVEERTVRRVSGNNVFLDKPLEFDHFSGIVDPTDLDNQGKGRITCTNRSSRRVLQSDPAELSNTRFEIKGEVGLLTRNVKIQGDESTIETGHGVHIMVRGEMDSTLGRFSFVEIFRAGQKFILGKYPIHYHMMGHVHDMYVRGCAIHQTFNRGTTIHGVHYLVVEDNVYYRTMGHTIFLEDGIETNNIIQRNLVVHVSVASSLLSSDMDPSGLWQARPTNYIRENHFVGSAGNGAWFELVASPTGPSATTGICPLGDHLLQYDRNVHHSNSLGLRVYPIYIPKTDPCMSNFNGKLRDPYSHNPGMPARFKENVMYLNGTGTFGRKIGAVNYVNQVLLSNGTNQTVAEPDAAKDSMAHVQGGVSVGNSQLTDFHVDAQGMPRFLTTKALGFGRKSGFLVKDSEFYNFNQGIFLSLCGACGNEKKRTPGGVRNNFENVKLKNVTVPLVNFRDALYDKDILYDKTGSLISQMDLPSEMADDFSAGGWITPWGEHLNIPECFRQTDPRFCSSPCAVCTNRIRLKTLRHQVLDDKILLYGQDMKLFNLDTNGHNFSFNMNESDADEQFGINKFRNCQLSIGFRGWLSVVATGYTYNFHFGAGVEWKRMRTENNYYWGLEGGELPVYLRHNHTEHRELFDSSFTGIDENEQWRSDNNKVIDVSVDGVNVQLGDGHNFGQYFYDSANETIKWKVDERRLGYFETSAVYCRDHCPEEEEIPETSPIEEQTRRWSDDAAWDELGQKPSEGDTVVIKAHWNMLLDVATPKLKHLKIFGRLSFDSAAKSSELNSHLVEIQHGGELLAGSASQPFTGKAKINLFGSKADPDVVIGQEIAPVNKAIVNKGLLELHGNPPHISWLRLAKKAMRGSSNLYLTNAEHGWAEGDQLVLASSTTDHKERELVTISRVEEGGSKIILKEKLEHNHYGSSEIVNTEQGPLDMRAEVGNLTRNIVIESDFEDQWGCTILTHSFVSTGGDKEIHQGKLTLDGVEIRNCGQKDTRKAAVDFNWLKEPNELQTVTRSSFNNGQGWAVNMYNSSGISFTDNVIFDARRYGIYMEKVSDVLVEGNLIVGVKERENYDNDEYWDVLIGVFYNDRERHWDRNRVTVHNNSVSSVPWFGFAVPGFNCQNRAVENLNFRGNSAHSCKAGWIPTKLNNQSCAQFSHFTAYKNDEQGFVQRADIDEIKVNNLVLADNRNAIAINGGNGQKYPFIWFRDSVVIGKALPDAPEFYRKTQCETSGFISGLFNQDKYDFYFEETRMPLHNSTNVHFSFGGRQELKNVVFRNFRDSEDCAAFPSSVAVKMNNFYQDNTSYVTLKKVTVDNVSDENKFYFANHKRHRDTSAYCGMRDCTGNYNTLFLDEDGAFFGKKMQFFGNNRGAGSDGDCTFFAEWNGHACNPEYMQLLVTRGKNSGEIIFPLKLSIEDYPEGFAGEKKFKHETDSPVTVTNLVKKGRVTRLQTSGAMPSGMAYQLLTSDHRDWAVFQVQAEDPSTMVVLRENPFYSNGKEEMRPVVLRVGDDLDMTAFSNDCGANHYDSATRTLHFVVRGIHCKVTVEFANALELHTLLNISPEKFYDNDGVTTFIDRIAALLGISIDRIKVVGLSSGSASGTTSLETSIRSATFLENDSRSPSDVRAELDKYNSIIEQAIADGTLDVDAPIMSTSGTVNASEGSGAARMQVHSWEDIEIEPNLRAGESGPEKIFDSERQIRKAKKTWKLGFALALAIAVLAAFAFICVKRRKVPTESGGAKGGQLEDLNGDVQSSSGSQNVRHSFGRGEKRNLNGGDSAATQKGEIPKEEKA